MSTVKRYILGIGFLVFTAVCLGVAAHAFYGSRFLTLTVAAVGVITFFGFLLVGHELGGAWALDQSGMRNAIAASMVVVYIVLVGLTAFIVGGPDKLPEITQLMLTNFTTIIGVVVAFYFGASAYVQAHQKADVNPKSPSGTP